MVSKLKTPKTKQIHQKKKGKKKERERERGREREREKTKQKDRYTSVIIAQEHNINFAFYLLQTMPFISETKA